MIDSICYRYRGPTSSRNGILEVLMISAVLFGTLLLSGCERPPQFPSSPPASVPEAVPERVEQPESRPFYHLYHEIVRTESGRLRVLLALIDRSNERLLAVTKLDFDGASMQFSEHANTLEAGTVEQVRLQIQPGETLDQVTASYRIDRGGLSFEREIPLRSHRSRYPVTPFNARIDGAPLHDVLRVFARALDTDLAVAGSIKSDRVTLTLQNLKWHEALDRVLGSHGLKWTKVGDLLLVYRNDHGYIRGHRSEGQLIGWHPPVKIEWEGFGEVYRVSPAWGVTAPTISERTKPIYTAEARENRVMGIVVVRALIDSDGRVRDAEIKRPLPFGLNEMALNAVKQWTFSPATFRQIPVPTSYDVVVHFDLP